MKRNSMPNIVKHFQGYLKQHPKLHHICWNILFYYVYFLLTTANILVFIKMLVRIYFLLNITTLSQHFSLYWPISFLLKFHLYIQLFNKILLLWKKEAFLKLFFKEINYFYLNVNSWFYCVILCKWNNSFFQLNDRS